MKKALFATTALVLTAGVAAAEVTVSGDARLGLRYETDTAYASLMVADDGTEYIVPGDNSLNVINRVRVKFALTGESQSGISFGANLRSDQHANSGDNNSATSGDVWVSGAYGKLTVGDIDGALEKAVGDLPEVGLSGLDYWNEFAYATSEEDDYDFATDTPYGDAGVLYEYAIGDAHIYGSFKDGYYGNSDVKRDAASWAVGAGYDLGNYSFGIGYERSDYTLSPFTIDDDTLSSMGNGFPIGSGDDSETWGISGGTSINGITFKAAYLTTSSDNDMQDYSQYGLGAEYDMTSGVKVAGYYRVSDFDNQDLKGDAFGIGAAYDLGGGATVKGGIVDTSIEGAGGEVSNTLADFGLEFKF
ncbi:MAG: porin [Paracoccus sp. (in: a-proteobacteria)]